MTDYEKNPATEKDPEELKTSEMRQGSRGRGTYYALCLGTAAAVVAVASVALTMS
ncbi:MAG: hypothetical protein KAH11_10730 [Rhodospirillales bacterium]|nr:hypothetical protein [Rhodospirillales bacterium]